MKIISAIKSFFPIAFVAIVVDESMCRVVVRIMKKGILKREEKKEFRAYKYEVPADASAFIGKYQASYRFCYVATLLNTENQGVMMTCKQEGLSQFETEAKHVELLCMNAQWSVYSDSKDIVQTKHAHEKSGGIDFVFSPFVLLYAMIKPQLTTTPKLYVLSQKNSITLVVMNAERLFYGNFLLFSSNQTQQDLKELEDKEDVMDAQMDAGDTTSEIENLDSLEEMDEIGELDSLIDVENEVNLDDFEALDEEESADDSENISNLIDLGAGLEIIGHIKQSIDDYYKGDRYESVFIEDIVLLDDSKREKALIDYIQESLLLTIRQEEINVVDTVCDLAMSEADSFAE
jgi:hypothetical protein